ncbi:MAG: hypothetical protein QOH70_1634 [Blastocatellia bacterium]|jgi:hypothetical protein|nr:hypothetical protein [Blastocatellia bacterium]
MDPRAKAAVLMRNILRFQLHRCAVRIAELNNRPH